MLQADEGQSLGIQQRQIEGYCHMLGFDVPTMFIEEGVSGSKPLNERPVGALLLANLQEGDIIIAAKLDRMFRSARDALNIVEEFKKKKVSLHLIDLGGDVTGNGISKLFFTIVAAFAEAERDRVQLRVRECKADQRKRGRHLGGSVTFGFEVVKQEGDIRGGVLVPVEAEQEAIAKMKALKAQGTSLRQIAAEMLKDGFQLSHQGVAKILDREQAAL
jgi:DNA invertase Pin-like site-specific DNA recombinase